MVAAIIYAKNSVPTQNTRIIHNNLTIVGSISKYSAITPHPHIIFSLLLFYIIFSLFNFPPSYKVPIYYLDVLPITLMLEIDLIIIVEFDHQLDK